MNALKKLWQRLAEHLPADELDKIQEGYARNAAADSRASYALQRKRQQQAKERREAKNRKQS